MKFLVISIIYVIFFVIGFSNGNINENKIIIVEILCKMLVFIVIWFLVRYLDVRVCVCVL